MVLLWNSVFMSKRDTWNQFITCFFWLTEYLPDTQRRQKRIRYGRDFKKRKEEQMAECAVQDACDDYVMSLGESKYHPQTKDALLTMDQEMFDEFLIVALIRFIVKTQKDGAILVFVPGNIGYSNY